MNDFVQNTVVPDITRLSRVVSGTTFYSILHLRRLCHRYLCCVQHILDEDAVPRGGIVDQHVGDGTNQLAVLDDRGAGQVSGQDRTTKFNRNFMKIFILG